MCGSAAALTEARGGQRALTFPQADPWRGGWDGDISQGSAFLASLRLGVLSIAGPSFSFRLIRVPSVDQNRLLPPLRNAPFSKVGDNIVDTR